MEGYRKKPRRDPAVHREVLRGQDRSKRKDRNKGKASVKKRGEGGGTPRDLREVERRSMIGMKTYLHGPIDYAKTTTRKR